MYSVECYYVSISLFFFFFLVLSDMYLSTHLYSWSLILKGGDGFPS